MVCLGNICRSPLAEGILRHKITTTGLNWQVDSAGTESYHIGEAPHPLSQKVAQLNGIDISMLRARQVTSQDFANFDLVFAMSADVLEELKSMVPLPKVHNAQPKLIMDEVFPDIHRSVPDPWYGPESGYHLVYHMLDQACDALISHYTTN